MRPIVRVRVIAFALAAAIGGAGPLSAVDFAHSACPVAHHSCERPVPAIDCCARDTNSTTQTPSKLQAPPENPLSTAASDFSELPIAPSSFGRIQNFPPRFVSLDRPTLFATLLI